MALEPLADGGAIYAVTVDGAIDVGNDTLHPLGGSDVFIARIGATGDVVWSRRVGGAGTDEVHSLAVVGDDVLAAGTAPMVANFGGANLPATSPYYVASWALSDGAPRESRRLPTSTPTGNSTLIHLARVDDSTVSDEYEVGAGDFMVDGQTVAATSSVKTVAVFLDAKTLLADEARVLTVGEATSHRRFHSSPSRALVFGQYSSNSVEVDGVVVGPSGGWGHFVTARTASGTQWLHNPPGVGFRGTHAQCRSASGTIAYAGTIEAGSTTIGSLQLQAVGGGLENRKSWVAALDPTTGDVLGAVEVQNHAYCAFLSDQRVALVGAKGMTIADLGL